MAFEFKLPDIGEGIHEGEIVQWLVQPGDFVKEDQAIVEVMTDKVTAEIPAPVSGVIQELRGKAGDVVKVGSVIVVFDQNASASESKLAASTAQTSASVEKTTPSRQEGSATKAPAMSASRESAQAVPCSTATNGNGTPKSSITVTAPPRHPSGKALAAPATRKLARQLGIQLELVAGSGPLGRITQDDVRQFQATGASQPTASKSQSQGFQSSGERRVPFTGLRRKIGEHLVKSKQTAPHFGYVEEVDMSKLVAMRADLLPAAQAEDVKLNYLPFVIKAVIAGLRKYPVLNAQLDEAKQEIVYKNDFHMGIAVATEQGLVVPVVKHADQKNLLSLAREISALAEKARSGKLALDDMRGGTFTITSIGSIGGLFGLPIINYPEVAILGVNKIEKRPVVRTIDGIDQIVIREMMHLSISGDHRVVDGAETALFIKEVIQYLENPSQLLLVEGA